MAGREILQLAGQRGPTEPASTAQRPGPIRGYGIVVAYAVAQAILLTAAGFGSSSAAVAAVTLGLATLCVGIAWRRPVSASGWWFVATSVSLTLAAHIAVMSGPFNATIASQPATLALSLAAFPALAVGLAVLSRNAGRGGGLADTIDASMVGAGTLLVAWVFIADVMAPARVGVSPAMFLLPLGALIVLVVTVKLVMSTGLRTTSLVLLALAALAFLASTFDMLLPDIEGPAVIGHRTSKMLWGAESVLVGAAATHPSFTRTTPKPRRDGTDLPTWRIVLFVAIAVAVPLALAFDLLHRSPTENRTVAGVGGPTAAAVALLLLLVGRLAMTARTSDRRAAVLKMRTEALADAVARQESLQRQLTERATHDPLTGLANRLVLGERMEAALAETAERGRSHTLLLLDLDGFKDINDTRGHPTGDELLIAVSRRLTDAAPPEALVARLGGDEFAILFAIAEPSDALAHAQDVLNAVRAPFAIGGQELFVSTSIGLLIIDAAREPGTPSDALRDADLSLYSAKNAGKNRIVAFTPRLRESMLERGRISAGLHTALARDEIVPNYQTVVSLDTGEVVAVEALARWRSPDRSAIPPARFIPVAESTGLIGAIGARMLQAACADACRWYERYGVAVSVNVSGQQLGDPRFADSVFQTLAGTGLPAAGLILEITESVLVDRSPDRPEFAQLNRLRAQGVRIAIDDFGTGYSSLSSIADLPVDIVKLDRSFAQDRGGATEPNWAFTGALLQVVASLGLQAIAEGVETPEQEQALRRLGCPWAQGYRFSRPAPPSAIDRVLSRR